MDVDEQSEQTETSDVDEAASYQQIPSSSRERVNEAPDNKRNTDSEPSTSKFAANDMQQSNSDSDGETMLTQNVEEHCNRQQLTQDSAQGLTETTSSVSVDNVDEEENQNDQHIENAGIDPLYPLVLVNRVSIPPGDNPVDEAVVENDSENAEGMEEEIEGASAPVHDGIAVAGRATVDSVATLFNTLARQNDEEVVDDIDDVDEDIETWSEEDEDEAAFLEHPNFRDFANQFETIRNMIAHTRRSMADAEANFGPVPRNSIMQRFRRVLFILNNRRRRLLRLGLAIPDVELPEAEANAEIEHNNEDTSENENEQEMNENAVRFDTNLPAEHSYMGTNMNRVSGVNYLEVGQYVKLRLFIHQHVLFPGEVLPFMVDSHTTITEGDTDAQNGILFGVCFPCLSYDRYSSVANRYSNDTGSKDELMYGVTCQIYELGEDNRGNTLIKSRALQRFVTKASDLTVPLEYINSHPRMICYGFVKILPDIYLKDPLKCINMGSMHRFRDNLSMQNMYKRMQAATTPWPAHIYETHNIANIIEKARTQLAQHKIDTMPSDPTQLSYWLVRNLHLPEELLKSIFLANTVNTRLKIIASTFKKAAKFICRNCAIYIADCRELFAMSKHGVQSQYCNSAGYVHETNTLYQINKPSILYSGSPSTEYSWFPGYQWHIIVCKICKHHLGWEFKAVEPNLIPQQFFGISSSSVRVRLAEDNNDAPIQNAAYINFLRLMNAGMNEFREGRNNMPNI